MTRLLTKYLKPFALGLLLAIALLFAQAMCDLNLPNYMSDIVNVGISQSGIENASPDAVSQNGMALAAFFMSEEEKKLAEDSYVLSEKEDYSQDYPKAEESFYVKKDIPKETEERLGAAFGSSAAAFIYVIQDMGEGGQGETGEDMTASINISEVYQVIPMLSSIPAEQIAAAKERAGDGGMLSNSIGIMFAKAFYEELGADLKGMQSSYIIRIGLYMLAIAFAGGAASMLVGFISSKIACGAARDIRNDLFAKVESFSNDEFDRFSTASLITRCTNDVTQIQMTTAFGIRMLCYAPIMGVGGVYMAIQKSSSMSWIIAVAVIALIGLVLTVASIALPKFKLLQKLVDKLNLVAREALSGLMVIRAFGRSGYERRRFDDVNKDLTAANLYVGRLMVIMMPLMMLIMNGVTLIIVWVGAHAISEASLQIGDMLAFMQYAMQIIMSFLMLSMMFIMLPRAAVSGERVREALEAEISITDPESPKEFDGSKKGLVEFKNVSFRYHGAEDDALSDITFMAKPGETTAIIGSTGSGKSTVANLILRFYDVTGGQILVDGADVREVRQSDLRAKIGYIPQKGNLLSGTVASNLRYGRDEATDEEIAEAADIAQASGFINDKPDKFDTEISQGGTNVSGGQRQRLSIARAIAKKPEILIFDDSFSALDFKTDAALRKALGSKIKDVTRIIIAQRVGTIMNADNIITLDDGKIVGMGTHAELIKNCPEYLQIASSQLSKEELA